MKTTARFILFTAVLAFSFGRAQAQVPPLHVGTTNTIVDEFGENLKGTMPAATAFGFTYATGEVVQILYAGGGIQPTDTNGNPQAANGVLYETRIGEGVDPGMGPAGQFGVSVPGRAGVQGLGANPTQVFARVYNKPTIQESSFYGDSQVFVVDANFNAPFIPEILRTDKPTDPNDNDLDGLNNSWEKSLHGNPNNPDTDGDGMADGPEFRAGTELTNNTSLLQMVELIPVPPMNLDIVWDTVDGKDYEVEYKSGDLADTNEPFSVISGVISATGLVSRTTVTNALANPGGHYRVKLIEP